MSHVIHGNNTVHMHIYSVNKFIICIYNTVYLFFFLWSFCSLAGRACAYISLRVLVWCLVITTPAKRGTFCTFSLFHSDCPASPDEEDLGAAGLLLRTYSAGPVSPMCYDLKGRELLRAATLDDSKTPNPVLCVIQVWPCATFIVFASSSSG